MDKENRIKKEETKEENEEEKAERLKDDDKDKLKTEINSNNNEDINDQSNIIIGTIQQAPKFLQENEYIKYGYIINCTSFKKALKCLFKFHNETMNTWTHLLGAIFFILLIFYTIFFITNFNIQLNIIKKDRLLSVEEKAVTLYELSPSSMNNYYNSVKNIQKNFNNYNQIKIYNETINNIFSLYNDVYSYISTIISNLYEYLKSFLEILSELKNDVIDLINLDESKTSQLESYLDLEIKRKMKQRNKKELTKLPIFIIIICAILCLSFSTCYHSLKIISPIIHNITHRFDHGGISLLISGSCFPPYYYFFYYENRFRYFYLIEISSLGLIIFFYSITSSDFSKPYKRTFRGILFLIVGICTGIPVLHMTFFGNSIKGYSPGIKLKNWYLGGISYIIGALLYILRFPEKKFQGKFDYVGSSHQLFHILVFFGAAFHYFGSLDAYEYRFKNLEL